MAVSSVGVVVPTYNGAETIGETLDSILGQMHCTVTVVVVDDGSEDDTVDRVRRLGDRRVKVIRQRNAGVSAARNTGVTALDNDLIAFCDQDDVWHPMKLARQWQVMQATGFDLSCTGYVFWHARDGVYPAVAGILKDAPSLELHPTLSGWIYHEMLLESQVLTSSALIRRSVAQRVGAWDESLEYAEDWDYWLRASRATPFAFLNAPMVAYRQRPDQGSRKARQVNWSVLVTDRAMRRWGRASPDGRTVAAGRLRRRRAVAWRDFGETNLLMGDMTLGRRAVLQAIYLDPWHAGQWKLLIRSVAGFRDESKCS